MKATSHRINLIYCISIAKLINGLVHPSNFQFHLSRTKELNENLPVRNDFSLWQTSLDEYEEETNAISQFGTRIYWDETYEGRGDFPMEEYSWYYGWHDTIKKIWMESVWPNLVHEKNDPKSSKILIPGIGNDSILVDLYASGWEYLTAFDYSRHAIDRQYDLLYTPNLQKGLQNGKIQLYVMDATDLNENKVINEMISDKRDEREENNESWTNSFDIIFEKGALDAIYLSSLDDNQRLRLAVAELSRVLRKNGIFVSVSGVVPEDLRRELFPTNDWEWIRDGSDDLQAGCFVWKKI